MSYELKALIAQNHLADAKLYSGKLDGDWGPLSQAAAEAWDDAKYQAAVAPPQSNRAGTAATPYSLALSHLGEKEIPGVKNNPLIVRWLRLLQSSINDEETAWCSAFANAMAQEAGYESSGKLNARSWLAMGDNVPLLKARRGDVVILWRVSPDSWEGHVAFLDHYDAGRGLVYLLGGNQGDAVSIAAYSSNKVLGVRRLRTLDSLQGNTGNRTV